MIIPIFMLILGLIILISGRRSFLIAPVGGAVVIASVAAMLYLSLHPALHPMVR